FVGIGIVHRGCDPTSRGNDLRWRGAGNSRRRHANIGVLRSMAERVIDEYDREHRLGDRRRTYPDTRIMAAVRIDDDRLSRFVDRCAIETNRRRRLDGDRDDDVLTGRNAAKDAARLIRQKTLRRHLVGMLGALLRDGPEAGADLDPLDGVDAHHRVRDVGVEFVIDGLTPADRNARRNDFDPRTAAITGFAECVHERLEIGDARCIRGEERIYVDVRPVLEKNDVGTELRQMATDRDAVPFTQPLACDRPGGDAYSRFARGLTPSAAIVADAIFLPIRVIGVTGTKRVGDIRVVFAALVLIADHERDRRSSRSTFEYA